MLPAVLHISKYMWLMLYLFLKFLYILYFDLFYYGRVPVDNGWRTASGTRTTILTF